MHEIHNKAMNETLIHESMERDDTMKAENRLLHILSEAFRNENKFLKKILIKMKKEMDHWYS